MCPCPRQATHASSAALAVSVGWWTGETALALSDAGGGVGLARLPGYGSLLAGKGEALRYAPGGLRGLVGCKECFSTRSSWSGCHTPRAGLLERWTQFRAMCLAPANAVE